MRLFGSSYNLESGAKFFFTSYSKGRYQNAKKRGPPTPPTVWELFSDLPVCFWVTFGYFVTETEKKEGDLGDTPTPVLTKFPCFPVFF